MNNQEILNGFPFFKKIGIPLHIEPKFDRLNQVMFDKGENCYIPIDGPLYVDQYVIAKGELYSQYGSRTTKLVKVRKEQFNHVVLYFKTKALLYFLPEELRKDILSLNEVCDNSSLSPYKECPILLFPYLRRILTIPNQILNMPGCNIYISDGKIKNSTDQMVQDRCECLTFCKIFILDRSDIPKLSLYGHLQINVQNQILKSRQHSLEMDQCSSYKEVPALKDQLSDSEQKILEDNLKFIFGPGPSPPKQQYVMQKNLSLNIEPRTKRLKSTKVNKKFEIYNASKIMPAEIQLSYHRQAKVIPRPRPHHLKLYTEDTYCLPIIKSYATPKEQLPLFKSNQKTTPIKNKQALYSRIINEQMQFNLLV